MLRTLEAIVDEQGHITLLEPTSLISGQRALVTLLEDEPGEAEWLAGASRGATYAFLNDPAEDLYSLTDGKKYGS
jgi:hypothetical protein